MLQSMTVDAEAVKEGSTEQILFPFTNLESRFGAHIDTYSSN